MQYHIIIYSKAKTNIQMQVYYKGREIDKIRGLHIRSPINYK